MTSKIETFSRYHIPGNPLILFNIWDAGSAIAVANAGAKAIATGSFGVARANGFQDGETLPMGLALANLERILDAVQVPVTIDMEAGYGSDPESVGASVAKAAEAGAAGINIEDKDPKTRQLLSVEDAAARIAASAKSGLFINARADQFIVTPKEEHGPAVVDAVIERAKAYADAGAHGLFVPFVSDAALIASLCEKSPLPVNILINPGVPDIATLAGLGVARISHGHGPWAKAMDALAKDAAEAMSALG